MALLKRPNSPSAPARCQRRVHHSCRQRSDGPGAKSCVTLCHATHTPLGGRKRVRTDPLAILHAADVTRQPGLVPLRYGRMLQTPFTFYRGSAGVMAADLAHTPVTGIHVQACGDAHLLNFGGFATPERRLLFDINDLDETLPAPWEWDVKRLVASFVLAARSNGLSDRDGRDAAIACARSYRKQMRNFADMDVLDTWYARLDETDFLAMLPQYQKAMLRKRIAKATARSSAELVFPKLVQADGEQPHIREEPPTIFHAEPALVAGKMDMFARQ